MPYDDPLLRPQQIRIVPGGLWHRRREGNGRNATACGIHFDEELCPATRPFRLDEKICEQCHTRHEMETSQIRALQKEAADSGGTFIPLAERLARRSLRDTHPDLEPYVPPEPDPEPDPDDER